MKKEVRLLLEMVVRGDKGILRSEACALATQMLREDELKLAEPAQFSERSPEKPVKGDVVFRIDANGFHRFRTVTRVQQKYQAHHSLVTYVGSQGGDANGGRTILVVSWVAWARGCTGYEQQDPAKFLTQG